MQQVVPLCREALEGKRVVLGNLPRRIINKMAQVLQDLGKFQQAESFCREALEA